MNDLTKGFAFATGIWVTIGIVSFTWIHPLTLSPETQVKQLRQYLPTEIN